MAGMDDMPAADSAAERRRLAAAERTHAAGDGRPACAPVALPVQLGKLRGRLLVAGQGPQFVGREGHHDANLGRFEHGRSGSTQNRGG